jgi:hypothetical protein
MQGDAIETRPGQRRALVAAALSVLSVAVAVWAWMLTPGDHYCGADVFDSRPWWLASWLLAGASLWVGAEPYRSRSGVARYDLSGSTVGRALIVSWVGVALVVAMTILRFALGSGCWVD